MRRHHPWALFVFSILLSLSLIACFGGHGGGGGGGNGGGGGGGNGGGGGGTTPGTVTIIEPTVQGAQVVAGATLDFEAKVKGGNGLGVTWGVQSGDTCTNNNFMSSLGAVGGAGNVGTMPATTPNQTVATYTAPSSLSGSAFITVTITALQSPQTTGPCLVAFVLPTKNALFNFNFVFRLKGFSNASGLPFGIIGRFFADGNGNITNGLEDVNIAQTDGSSAAFPEAAFKGTYNMDTSSHGTMTLTVASPTLWSGSGLANPPPTTMNFSFTLSVDGTFGGLIETDGNARPAYVGSGDFQFQGNSVNFTTTNIVGSYLVSLAGTGGVGPSAVSKGVVGRLDLTALTSSTGNIANTSSSDDQSGGGPTQLTGAYTIDDPANGHGTFAITGGSTRLVSFYIGGPKRFYALRMDPNLAGNEAILLGAVHFMPASAPFTNTSVGAAVFQLLGITTNGHASAAVGVFVSGAQISPPSTTNGFLQGIMDLNDGGSVPNNLPIAFNPNSPATFTIAPNGRGTVSIVLPGPGGPATYHFVFYLRTQGVGYLLEQPASDGSNRGRSGVFFPQNVTFGPNGTFIGSTEVATAASANGLAVIPITVSGSSGNFQNAAEDISKLGSAATLGSSISGTFTATDANNRGTVAMTNSSTLAGSATAAFYVLTDDEAILVGTDATNTEPQIIVLTNSIPDI
jgi:hypothetical protein